VGEELFPSDSCIQLVRSVMPPTLLEASSGLAPGREVLLKREDLGPNGAFKWRGALCGCQGFVDEGWTGVAAASTGNHGAGVAWAAARLKLDSHVVVPKGASPRKCALIESLGAQLHRHGRTISQSADHARALAEELGLAYFDDGAVPAQLGGTATIGTELLSAEADCVVVPVGCGALIAGIAAALDAGGSETAVVGVQSAGYGELTARFHGLSWSPDDLGTTFADGLAETRIVEPAFSLVKAHVDDVLTVEDSDLAEALRALAREAGIVVEGAAAAPLAALQRFPERIPGTRVILVISGRNLDPGLFDSFGIEVSTSA
jgi:threonine dehydratase